MLDYSIQFGPSFFYLFLFYFFGGGVIIEETRLYCLIGN